MFRNHRWLALFFVVSVASIDLLLICPCMHINSIFVECDAVLQSSHQEIRGEVFLSDCHDDLLDLGSPT